MTSPLIVPSDDYAHQAAKGAYVSRDADTMRELARANESHPWVQIEAAHLAADFKQPQAVMHYLGAAAKASPETCLRSWYYWHLMAIAMAQLGDQGEGESAARMAVNLGPSHALLWLTFGTYAFQRGDWQEGHARYAKCLEVPPRDAEDSKAQGEALLWMGRWKEGWKKWEARTTLRSIRNAHKFSCPEWRGERLNGKRIVVWAEQGAGDQIQFLRFLPLLKARGATIDLRVMKPLLPWCADLKTRGTVTELGAEGEVEAPDYHVALMSLAGKLKRYNPQDWPEPYHPDIPLEPVKGRIGYSWRGNPEHGNDHDRSHPERAEWEWRLGKTDQWVNLTGNDEDSPKGWMETAKVIATCEKVVTVDTAIAHVAGSLGVPTVIVLASAPEWRWCFRHEPKTPWYPSARIVRKRYLGDWHDSLDTARGYLESEAIWQ